MQTFMKHGTPPHPDPLHKPRGKWLVARHLDPAERMGEVLFGLIMVLTFTLGAGLIVAEGKDATSQMLWGVVGCNFAWGFIDGVMYILSSMLERSRKARLLVALKRSTDEEDALAIVGSALDDRLGPLTSREERRRLYREIARRLADVPPERTRLKREDLYGAAACFVLVFMSTIPAVAPFLLFENRFVALRVSNLLLLTLLFLVGARWARSHRGQPLDLRLEPAGRGAGHDGGRHRPGGMMGRGSRAIACVALLIGDPAAGDEARSPAARE